MIIAPGITFRPLDSKLTVFDLASAGAVGFREWAVLEPVSFSCTCEIESARAFATAPGYDTLNRAWLASSLLVLRGFTRHVGLACSAYSWSEIAGCQQRSSVSRRSNLGKGEASGRCDKPEGELGPFKGGLLDFHISLLVNSESRIDAPTEDDAAWIQLHFATFDKLAAESERFRFALTAAVDWRYSKDLRTAVARLWAGIESLLVVNSELVYRISLISSALLAPRGEPRRDRFKSVKRLYGLRSKAVHGEAMPEVSLVEAMNESCRLLRDLLLISIEKGRVLGPEDFDKAIFD